MSQHILPCIVGGKQGVQTYDKLKFRNLTQVQPKGTGFKEFYFQGLNLENTFV